MEILLASAVFAALVTSLVNLVIAGRNSQSARDLEVLKSNLAVDINSLRESFTNLKLFREWLVAHDAKSLLRQHNPSNSTQLTKFCTHHVPIRFEEYREKVIAHAVYMDDARVARISEAAERLRCCMETLVQSLPPSVDQDVRNEAAAKMFSSFDEYCAGVLLEVEQALMSSQGSKKL